MILVHKYHSIGNNRINLWALFKTKEFIESETKNNFIPSEYCYLCVQ